MASIYPLGIVWRHGASDSSKACEKILQMVYITLCHCYWPTPSFQSPVRYQLH